MDYNLETCLKLVLLKLISIFFSSSKNDACSSDEFGEQPAHGNSILSVFQTYVAVGSDVVHWLACSLSDPGD